MCYLFIQLRSKDISLRFILNMIVKWLIVVLFFLVVPFRHFAVMFIDFSFGFSTLGEISCIKLH